MTGRSYATLAVAMALATAAPAGEPATPPGSALETAVERLQLPGVKINLPERAVDLAATVCLDAGTLELVACKKDTKEHESIVAIDATAVHVHTALLLLGAKAGHPAVRQRVGGEDGHWVDVPPTGGKVEVSIVVTPTDGDPVERPVTDFLKPAGAADDGDGDKKFPTHTFLFAGSALVPNPDGDGPRTYLADRDGNIISIATFGDEVLCLPGVHSHQSGALLWQVDNTHLPPVGTKVTLRLRPQKK